MKELDCLKEISFDNGRIEVEVFMPNVELNGVNSPTGYLLDRAKEVIERQYGDRIKLSRLGYIIELDFSDKGLSARVKSIVDLYEELSNLLKGLKLREEERTSVECVSYRVEQEAPWYFRYKVQIDLLDKEMRRVHGKRFLHSSVSNAKTDNVLDETGNIRKGVKRFKFHYEVFLRRSE